MHEHAESFGFAREDRSKFKVTFVWIISLFHSDSRKLGSAPARHVFDALCVFLRLFLHVSHACMELLIGK